MFLPVVCTYSDSTSAKIYLVKDLDEGIAMLKSSDLKYTVTNGDVAECAFLPLTWGADVNATEPDWATYEDSDWLDQEDAFAEDIEFGEEAFKDGTWDDQIVDDDEEPWFDEFEELMFDDDVYFE
jgi:hypothetical protein